MSDTVHFRGAPEPAEHATPVLREMLFGLINAERNRQGADQYDPAERVDYRTFLLRVATNAVRELEDYWLAEGDPNG
jgi:hypothetical protein